MILVALLGLVSGMPAEHKQLAGRRSLQDVAVQHSAGFFFKPFVHGITVTIDGGNDGDGGKASKGRLVGATA